MLMRELDLDGTPIDGYGTGGFRIGGEWYDGSILLTAKSIQSCTLETFNHTMIGENTVLLIGTGAQMTPLPAAIRTYLQDHDIAHDIMQTASACRTYNVLLAEDRNVAALLTHL